MKIVRLLLLAMIIISLNGCKYSIKTNFISILKQNRPVYHYLFSNNIKQQEISYLFYRDVKLEIDITFDHSPEDLIKKRIDTDDFESKIGNQKLHSFQIDSVSFSAELAPNQYDLFYFAQINGKPQKVQFALVKKGKIWEIH